MTSTSLRAKVGVRSGTLVKRALQRAAEAVNSTESVSDPDLSDVRSMFIWTRDRHRSLAEPWRPQYAWSVLHAARTARALGYGRISVLEFGVAGGIGLIALEAAAESAEELLGVGIDVIGFDTGGGLPPPSDYRDLPFMLSEGDFAMDEKKLRGALKRSQLILGDVAVTAGDWVATDHAPIGFIAFDMDYYSATMTAFAVLDGPDSLLLPRVMCYFDDLLYPPWSEFDGEAAAITEFNATHQRRKIAKLSGLRYLLPRSEFRAPWPELMYMAQIFDHARFSEPEGHPQLDLSLAR